MPTHAPAAEFQDLGQTHLFGTSLTVRIVNLAAVIIPFASLVLAVVLLWGVAFNWIYLGLMLGMYIVTGLGITVGYHRYFTHRSFDTSRPVAFLLAAVGSMACQGSVLEWAAIHRRHHHHSDGEEDPHSPHSHGGGVWGVIQGAWHAHIGWLFVRRSPDIIRYVGDLRKDAMVRAVSRGFGWWVLLGLLIPAAIAGLLTMSWTGALLGLLWGGLVRVHFVHHITWSVNSVCHIWGSRPFNLKDESRNNPIMGILALGEGWHNNHHAFPTSARHGLRWWQFDLSYLVIRLLGVIGLARNIRTPAPHAVVAKAGR